MKLTLKQISEITMAYEYSLDRGDDGFNYEVNELLNDEGLITAIGDIDFELKRKLSREFKDKLESLDTEEFFK